MTSLVPICFYPKAEAHFKDNKMKNGLSINKDYHACFKAKIMKTDDII